MPWPKLPKLKDESAVVVRCRRCRLWLASPAEVAARKDGWCYCEGCVREWAGLDAGAAESPTEVEDAA